jgi:hypothetical protein
MGRDVAELAEAMSLPTQRVWKCTTCQDEQDWLIARAECNRCTTKGKCATKDCRAGLIARAFTNRVGSGDSVLVCPRCDGVVSWPKG